MSYVHIPNLPQADVSLVAADGRISKKVEENLLKTGIKVIKTCKYPGLYEAVSCHPDIMLHHIGEEYIVHAPEVDVSVLHALSGFGFKLICGNTPLTFEYPGNIAYNVARVGNFAFHNLKYTDSTLKSELERRNIEFIHVKQGYAKCSISVVDENSIITADAGIAKAAHEKGIEVLLIEPEEDILLPGLKNGFIGGSTVLLGKSRWAVAGNFELLRSADTVRGFLMDRNIDIESLSEEQIVDIGSVIPLQTK